MAINMRTYGRDNIVLDSAAINVPPPPGTRGGNQRATSRSDVSIQVDVATGGGGGARIGSGNSSSGGGWADRMGRSGSKKSLSGGGGGGAVSEIPLYSREDIREQYCINSRKDPLDSRRRSKGFFGCLTSRKDKSKKKRSSFFALCVRRSSDDNLYNGYNKPIHVNAGGPRSITMPALKPFTVPLREDGPGSFRNRPQSFCTGDPRRFSVQPVSSGITTPCLVNAPSRHHSDHEFKFNTLPLQRSGNEVEPTGGGGIRTNYQYGGRLAYTQPNTPELSIGQFYHRRQVMSSEALTQVDPLLAAAAADRRSTGSSKHVSFDASSPSSEIYTSAIPANASKSQERLLGSKTPEAVHQQDAANAAAIRQRQHGAAFSPVLARAILLERLRQASMRSQATQTEGFYNSTTSLSYPLSIAADSQISIPGALNRANRQVQTQTQHKIRLSKSFSSVHHRDEDDEGQDDKEQAKDTTTPRPLSRRPEEMSQSQPEKIGATDSEETISAALVVGHPARFRSANQRRRHKMLKALSEGTILIDRKNARNFASGYVEVQTEGMEQVDEPPAGCILVHDPADILCSSGLSSSEDELARSRGIPTSTSLPLLDDDEDEIHGWSDQSADHPPPPPRHSNTWLPDTPDSDDLGSTSLVTVVKPHPLISQIETSNNSSFVVSIDADATNSQQQHPPTPPPRRSTLPAPLSLDLVDPPLPEAIAAAAAVADMKEIMVQFPPWPHSPQGSELIPAPPNFASGQPPPPPPQPPMGMTERVLLRHLKSKSISETITSVDSDSSAEGRRMTEHETSISSPEIPEVNDDNDDKTAAQQTPKDAASSGETSEALFLTAVSDPTATSLERFNTAMDTQTRSSASHRDRESDTGSHNSTLRTDHPAPELPYESPPPEVAAEISIATSPESVDGGAVGGGGRASSSTSGSYSLDAPASPPEEFASLGVKPSSPSPPPPPPEVDSAVRVLKEAMKLQFPSGGGGEALATPQSGSGGRRRKPFQQSSASLVARNLAANNTSSSDSDNDDDRSSSARTKWRPGQSNNKKSSSSSSISHTAISRDFIVQQSAGNKTAASVEVMTPGMVRSPAMHEGFRIDDWVARTPRTPSQVENVFSTVVQRPSESGSSPIQPSAAQGGGEGGITAAALHRLAPSPSHHCDSARSISPGSDNVFVSESTEMLLMSVGGTGGPVKPPEGFADSPVTREPVAVDNESQLCAIKRKPDSGRGKRAKSCTLPSGSTGESNKNDHHQDLDCDSACHHQPVRAVSTIDVWYPETQLPPKRTLTVRAKSEERERWNRPARRNLERFAQSMAGCSWDSLGTKVSCDGTPLDDEDAGIYNASYRAAAWAYIGETEELLVWQRQPQLSNTPTPDDPLQELDDSSTASEKDFRRKYTSITHRMVHRKSSVEMFRRLATSTFDCRKACGAADDGQHISLRHSLEDVYHLMLMIWCRERLALRALSTTQSVGSECDDIVLVKRESGEFGFRIHGSRPVVVSAIEPGTPAEISGLQVGDIIISINDVNVLESSHSDVVRIAHAGSDELKLEVARTCHVLAAAASSGAQQQQQMSNEASNEAPILVGYLWKKSQSASRADESNPVWYRRWFVLKRDNCLYYYKNQESSQPLGAVSLLHHTVTRSSFTDRPYGLLLSKGGTIRHWLSAENAQSVDLWLSVFHQASKSAIQEDVWLDLCTQNIQLPPGQMVSPDCVGHLMKLGHRAKEWQRRFCLLKDACLYFYVDINVSSALGALHLHGYRVQSSGTSASSGERRKFAFELLPPEPRMRHFHFYTDSENDRKRWIAALEYSIDRWIRVG